jgi:hypothetical protein
LYSNFKDPNVLPMLLRGVSWAAKYPVDALANVMPARGGGGGRGGRQGGRGAGAPGGPPPAGRGNQ